MTDRSDHSGLRIYTDAVVIVVGGASGIGEALARELAIRGALVVIADLDGELAAQVASSISEQGGKASYKIIDVCDHAGMDGLVEETVSQHGRLDFMFNMVGIIYSGTALDHEIDDWNRVLDVNIRGVVNGVAAAYPIMAKQGFGHIINMSSAAGLVPFYNVAYTTSRFAIVGMSLTLRGEASLNGVRVTVLCPGAVQTATFLDAGKFGKRLRDIPDEVRQATLKRLKPINAERFVEVALRQIARNRAIVVAPWRARSLWRSFRRTPILTTHIIFKHIMKPVLLEAEKLSQEEKATSGAKGIGEGTDA